MSKHTAGPWRATRSIFADGAEVRWFIQFDGTIKDATIAAMNSPCLAYDNAEADARVIAAAPELLEAAKAAKKYLEPNLVEPGRTVFWNLVAAIAKAEGR